MNGRIIPIGIIIALLLAGGYYFYSKSRAPAAVVANFEECKAAGYPLFETYPARCTTPEGKTFTQDIGNELEKRDLIRISAPRPNEKVASPLTITGEARGNWYFEASFPIELRDASGNTIAQHYAEAQGEWMTTDFVPFKSQLSFPPQPAGSKGTLILHKDNPSGLLEHDDALIVPVVF